MKEIIYNITQAMEGRVITFDVEEVFSKDNILGIINKTQSKVLYTPVQAANIADVTYNEGTLTILLSDNVPVTLADDELFIKLYSENEEKIDTTELAKEQTLIDKATELAKQGEDDTATNSKILQEVNNVKNTFDQLDIPLSAISGLALELEDGKKNIINALKARGVEAYESQDTLTSLASKIYAIENPIIKPAPANTANEFANNIVNTIMQSQEYDQIYESIKERWCGEGKTYVGCLMTSEPIASAAVQLTGADAYYIYEEDIFYTAGLNGNLIQIIDGVSTQLSNKIHMWNDEVSQHKLRTIFYFYLPDSTADGKRENRQLILEYCRETTIPNIYLQGNGGVLTYLHVNNVDSCNIQCTGGSLNKMLYFYTNVESVLSNMNITARVSADVSSIKLFKPASVQGSILKECSIKKVNFPNLQRIEGGYLLYNCRVNKIFLPELSYLHGTLLANDNVNIEFVDIDLPKIEEISGNIVSNIPPKIIKLKLKSGVKVQMTMRNFSNNGNQTVVYIECDELYSLANNETYPAFNGAALIFEGLKKANLNMGTTGDGSLWASRIYINCIGDRTDEIKFVHSTHSYASTRLTDIEISEGTRQPLYFYSFRGLLAENIVNHIFERLADNNFEDDGVTPAPAITITIGAENLNKLTDEQKAIATDKNYILA